MMPRLTSVSAEQLSEFPALDATLLLSPEPAAAPTSKRSSDTFTGLSAVAAHLHRYRFESSFHQEQLPPGTWMGCGVTAVDRADAEALLGAGPFAVCGLPSVERVIEDVDVRDLDQNHVQPTWVTCRSGACGSHADRESCSRLRPTCCLCLKAQANVVQCVGVSSPRPVRCKP